MGRAVNKAGLGGFLIVVAAAASASAAPPNPLCGLPPLDPSTHPLVGLVQNRSSLSIANSTLSVGAETMDRGYTNYSSWGPYLAALGAKHARVQAGWTLCEPTGGGVYDWSYLDTVVGDMTAKGVEPWLQLSFGNANYEGGGNAGVGSPLPLGSSSAVDGWSSWVRAVVTRYGVPGIVTTWEIWNEPNNVHITALDYANLTAITGAIIKLLLPGPMSSVRYGVVAGVDGDFVANVSSLLAGWGDGGLVDVVTYHPYEYNPDAVYADVEYMKKVVGRVLPHVTFAQGENGAPSQGGGYGALSAWDWDECSQAKWMTRRLVHDSGLGIPSSLFSIADMCYAGSGGGVSVNHKGLLLVNCSARGLPYETDPVLRPKQAYYSMQHVTSVFDGVIAPVAQVYPGANFSFSWVPSGPALPPTPTDAPSGLVIEAFAWAAVDGSGRILVALWNASGTPLNVSQPTLQLADVTISITGMPKGSRVRSSSSSATYVAADLLGGSVFGLPAPTASAVPAAASGNGASDVSLTFPGVPISDFVVAVADESLLHLVPPPPRA